MQIQKTSFYRFRPLRNGLLLMLLMFAIGYVSVEATYFRANLPAGFDDASQMSTVFDACPILNVDAEVQNNLNALLASIESRTEPTLPELARSALNLDRQDFQISENTDLQSTSAQMEILALTKDVYALSWDLATLQPQDLKLPSVEDTRAILYYQQFAPTANGAQQVRVEQAYVALKVGQPELQDDVLFNHYHEGIIPQDTVVSAEQAVTTLGIPESIPTTSELVYLPMPITLPESDKNTSAALAYRIVTEVPLDETLDLSAIPEKYIGEVTYVSAVTGEVLSVRENPAIHFANIPTYFANPIDDKGLYRYMLSNDCPEGTDAETDPRMSAYADLEFRSDGGVSSNETTVKALRSGNVFVIPASELFLPTAKDLELPWQEPGRVSDSGPKDRNGTSYATGNVCVPGERIKSRRSAMAQLNLFGHLVQGGLVAELADTSVISAQKIKAYPTNAALLKYQCGKKDKNGQLTDVVACTKIPTPVPPAPAPVGPTDCRVITYPNNYTDTDRDDNPNTCDEDDDNDTIADGTDNCPLNSNVSQSDTDQDTIGDACDTDDDTIKMHFSYTSALDTEAITHELAHAYTALSNPLLARSSLTEAKTVQEAIALFYGVLAAPYEVPAECPHACPYDRRINDRKIAACTNTSASSFVPTIDPCREDYTACTKSIADQCAASFEQQAAIIGQTGEYTEASTPDYWFCQNIYHPGANERCRILHCFERLDPNRLCDQKYQACLTQNDLDMQSCELYSICSQGLSIAPTPFSLSKFKDPCGAGFTYTPLDRYADYTTTILGMEPIPVFSQGVLDKGQIQRLKDDPDTESALVARILLSYYTDPTLAITNNFGDGKPSMELSQQIIRGAVTKAVQNMSEPVLYNDTSYPLVHTFLSNVHNELESLVLLIEKSGWATVPDSFLKKFEELVYEHGYGLVVGSSNNVIDESAVTWTGTCVAATAQPVYTIKIPFSGMVYPPKSVQVDFVSPGPDAEGKGARAGTVLESHSFFTIQPERGSPKVLQEALTLHFDTPAYLKATITDTRGHTSVSESRSLRTITGTQRQTFQPASPWECITGSLFTVGSTTDTDPYRDTDNRFAPPALETLRRSTGANQSDVRFGSSVLDIGESQYSFFGEVINTIKNLNLSYSETASIGDQPKQHAQYANLLLAAEPRPPAPPKPPTNEEEAGGIKSIELKEFVENCKNFRALPVEAQVRLLKNLSPDYLSCGTPDELEMVRDFYNGIGGEQGYLPPDMPEAGLASEIKERIRIGYPRSSATKVLHGWYYQSCDYAPCISVNTRTALITSGRFPEHFPGVPEANWESSEIVGVTAVHETQRVVDLALMLTGSGESKLAREAAEGRTLGSILGGMGSMEFKAAHSAVDQAVRNLARTRIALAEELLKGAGSVLSEKIAKLIRELQTELAASELLRQQLKRKIAQQASKEEIALIKSQLDASIAALEKKAAKMNTMLENVKAIDALGISDLPPPIPPVQKPPAQVLAENRARKDIARGAPGPDVPVLSGPGADRVRREVQNLSVQRQARIASNREANKTLFANNPSETYGDGGFTAGRQFQNLKPLVPLKYHFSDREYAKQIGRLFENVNAGGLQPGEYTYVLLKDGELRFGLVKDSTEFGVKHAHLANGEKVVAAGELKIDTNGSYMFNLESGSFMKPLIQIRGVSATETAERMKVIFEREFQRAGTYTDNVLLPSGEVSVTTVRFLCKSKYFLKRNSEICQYLLPLMEI